MKSSVHAIVLTFNEELHIARCIDSLNGQCASVTIIDSGSTDATVAIAQSYGCEVMSNKWVNYSSQLNFGIDRVSNRGGWLLRIDADEVLDSDSSQTLNEVVCAVGDEVDGILLQRRIIFLNRRMRYGGIEPSWQLRLWRNGRGRCERRWMDEHIQVFGSIRKSKLILSDKNENSLTWWTAKHNSYASREAIDILSLRYDLNADKGKKLSSVNSQAKLRRFLKEVIYARLPAGLRPVFYFLYRYIVRLGFLDGREGYYFHLLQGFWYRSLVDAKLLDLEEYCRKENVDIRTAILDRLEIDLTRFDS